MRKNHGSKDISLSLRNIYKRYRLPLYSLLTFSMTLFFPMVSSFPFLSLPIPPYVFLYLSFNLSFCYYIYLSLIRTFQKFHHMCSYAFDDCDVPQRGGYHSGVMITL